jgi:hypothetical protein
MALGAKYYKSAVFITGTRETGQPADKATLRGTGFAVAVPAADPKFGFFYIVTAAHVVRPLGSTFVKLTKQDKSIVDVSISEWTFHPTEDIAVAEFPDPVTDYYFSFVSVDDFLGAGELEWKPGPGSEVYFAGLLGQVPSMGTGNVPMVRSGTIGALDQSGIPMRLPDDTVIKVNGHLIDCRSFGGFSGSPCFVRFISATGKTEKMGLQYPIESTLLLGMVGGHFDLRASVTMPDQESGIKVPVAAGVAVIYPAEMIKETLEQEPFVAEREAAE